MKFKIKDMDKPKKVRVKKTGTKRPLVIALWVLLIVSTTFGIYNNINSVERVYNNETIINVDGVKDVSGVIQFVRNFIKVYYVWDNTEESVAKRAESINEYLTLELQELNKDTVRIDVPVTSRVDDIQIWSVDEFNSIIDIESEEVKSSDYKVLYTIVQVIKENDNSDRIKSTYEVVVHADADGSMVITGNPTIASSPALSAYEPEGIDADGTVTAAVKNDALDFLKTFFKMYPSLAASELSYYVKDNALEAVTGDYIFSEIINPVYYYEDEILRVSFAVSFLDNATKMTQVSQYDLGLFKENGNWVITDSRRLY